MIAGRYRLLDQVGRGGMGTVWRAEDELLHRQVAIKQVVLPAWLGGDELDQLRARTLREARTAARLNHPNVVRVYDVVSEADVPWIVMEYVPSRTLQDLLDADGPLPPRRAARIGLALLDALRAAHDAGVLHRDVKPANVLVADDGRVLLTDFGLAVFDGGDQTMTGPGTILGSPQYVAPERAAEGVSSEQADLWSLGATLHAAVEGRAPYARSTAMATLSALAAAPPDPAPHAGPLSAALAGLLRRDPAHRTDHAETRRRLLAAAGPADEPARPGEQTTSLPTAGSSPAGTAASLGAATAPATAAASPRREPAGQPTADEAARPPVGHRNQTRHDPDQTHPEAPDRAHRHDADRSHRDEPDQTSGHGPERIGDSPSPTSSAGTSTGTPDAGPRRDAVARPWALAAVAVLVAMAAGIGTALTVVGTGADQSSEPGSPQPYDVGAPGPDNPFPRDGRRPPPPPGGFVPPPLPCVRPWVDGASLRSAPPRAGDRFRPPAGWVWHADAGGFRVALPADWRHSREDDVACFQDPATGRAFTVADSADATTEPTARLRAVRDRELAGGTLPGYQEFRLGRVGDAIEWEFSWLTPHGDRLRATQIVPDGPARGRSWTLGWITHERDWTTAASQLATVRLGFRAGR
ncbi:serine/threonine-protein kinase [Verrucosispora sp. WMMA2121]|uniref:serine/threonine-protein kinase n=1 Tax=Verrucosispora sp. WMMA2121 TaxID=3015164 RepID=UPI0022B6165E|nr:serine/threonine-protein kinase [Verrucosispora sp. WMMA2121]MCZ7423855.1 serine/threonine-protein kinase [Verrucosispora sp. WMMA2121]